MANKRKAGIERVTLTLPDELLRELEEQAALRGMDRLALIRDVMSQFIDSKKGVQPKPKSKKVTSDKDDAE